MAYLEQSTRYIAYDARLPSGHYRYHRPPEILDSPLGARYVGDMDRMFDAYAELLPQMVSWIGARHPRQAGDSDFVHRQAVRAKALDELRGLLPAASLSNVGIYGTGQSYELLLLRMRSDPLPEARHYAEMVLTELRKVIPSFLQRVDLAERGGEWSAYLAATRDETARVVERLWPDGGQVAAEEPAEVTLLDFDPEGEDKVLAAACFAHGTVSDAEALRRVRALGGRGPPGAAGRLRGGAAQPPAPTGSGLRADRLPVRGGVGLRGLPGPPAAPDADRRVAAAVDVPRLRRPRAGGRGGTGRPLHRVDRALRRSCTRSWRTTSRPRPPTRWPWPSASATSCR